MQVKMLNENSDYCDPKRFNDERKALQSRKLSFLLVSFLSLIRKNKKPLRNKKEIP